ncbi:hypothetical protein KC318_g1364 [Hortaea werneckii]|uniref:Aspergillus nuclease S(1) n=1 Tax=Hortaea werneckii TaxID=91943 RepID=A0A3M7B9L3_HORWE|nr:hypothetical protein KC334_g3663 [Hortaea werneckii]KAI7023263.1 hypothetical protein KC355_g1779 [Hortaea werneckii]KAI7674792.1 hypothetical protein KC318_g1364 [Hortaea werneckii]RMY25211.1 hypothetical protein D0867_00865 [Hortaea werneckii]RMY36429.1 hypothetical protein D0866_03939 [Hortaea werneckii]
MLRHTAGRLLALVALPHLAACWGSLGHRTVGYLAQHYFTDAAAQLFEGLINPSEHFDVSDAAVWADRIRWRRHYTGGWHFIDANDSPPETCNVNFSRDCEEDRGCVVSALANQTALLLDLDQTRTTRNEALKFLLHFVGDLHQPLHTEALDRGGNQIQVKFDNRHYNLHSVWDTEIALKMHGLTHSPGADAEKTLAKRWAQELYNKHESADFRIAQNVSCDPMANTAAAQSCALEYAAETNQLICSYVLQPGLEWFESNDLGGEYYDGAKTIVEDRIAIAGMRLGMWMNAVAYPLESTRLFTQT